MTTKVCVVSDTHIGADNANTDAFSRFLDLIKGQNMDEMILLGDILDFWVADNKTIFERAYPILKKLEKLKTKIIYVVGNHDLTQFEYAGEYPPDLEITDKYTRRIGDKFYLFVHGHQFDSLMRGLRPFRRISLIAELLSAAPDIQRFITGKAVSHSITRELWCKIARYLVDRPKNLSFGELRKLGYYSHIELPSGKIADALVYGHTHVPEILHYREGIIINSGSWVDEKEQVNNTSVFIDENGPAMYRYDPDRGAIERITD
jgi:UDP-2,3-diacylglucosamine pyrophosphatase LpxH